MALIQRLIVRIPGAFLVGMLALGGTGCSTDAVGVDACRLIESARCDAAPTCEGDPDSSGIVTEVQVENCKTFYRDHCLVGIENDQAEPDGDDVTDCVEAIGKVAKCQTDKVETMADCDVEVESGGSDLSPCGAMAEPELITACAFVAAEEEE